MVRLFIARHGETKWNIENRLQGWNDSPLTEKGIRHAELLGKRLKDTHFQSIYVSSSGRALQTARIVLREREQQMIVHDDLREIYLGNWEGKTFSQLEEKYPVQFPAFINRTIHYQPDNGEDFASLQKRVKTAIEQIVSDHHSGNIFIITHSVCIEVLLAHFKKLPLEQLGTLPVIKDTSLTIVDVDHNYFHVKLVGDTSHYENE